MSPFVLCASCPERCLLLLIVLVCCLCPLVGLCEHLVLLYLVLVVVIESHHALRAGRGHGGSG